MPLAACLALGLLSSLPPPAIYPPRGEQIVPADCRFVARLKTKIYSDKSRVGDAVELETSAVVSATDGAVYIPRGAHLKGTVSRVQLFDQKKEHAAQLSILVDRAE